MSPTPDAPLLLALALGGGHPRSTAFWSHLVREAETGLLDLVTLDTADDATGAGEDLDAVLVATRLAATTREIGLVPTVHVGRSEPGRLARAVRALDEASGGRAGVQLQVPVPADEAGWVASVRRRWSADGRDAHDDGGPVVALPGRPGRGRRALPAAADLAFVTPRDAEDAARLAAASRSGDAPRRLLGDVVVVLDEDADRARRRAAHLGDDHPALDGAAPTTVFAGTPAELADLAQEWRAAGLAGLRLHPAELTRDLRATTRGLVPELQRRGAFPRGPHGTPLRERLERTEAPAAGAATAAEHCTAA